MKKWLKHTMTAFTRGDTNGARAGLTGDATGVFLGDENMLKRTSHQSFEIIRSAPTLGGIKQKGGSLNRS
jgi:hypothetical protein